MRSISARGSMICGRAMQVRSKFRCTSLPHPRSRRISSSWPRLGLRCYASETSMRVSRESKLIGIGRATSPLPYLKILHNIWPTYCVVFCSQSLKQLSNTGSAEDLKVDIDRLGVEISVWFYYQPYKGLKSIRVVLDAGLNRDAPNLCKPISTRPPQKAPVAE